MSPETNFSFILFDLRSISATTLLSTASFEGIGPISISPSLSSSEVCKTQNSCEAQSLVMGSIILWTWNSKRGSALSTLQSIKQMFSVATLLLEVHLTSHNQILSHHETGNYLNFGIVLTPHVGNLAQSDRMMSCSFVRAKEFLGFQPRFRCKIRQ